MEGRPSSDRQWTPEQWSAVTARGSDLLVSAAAGAGKTAVLVERIIQLILGEAGPEAPVDVDRLLVVTFTEAAAAEIRGRVAQALRRRLETAETARLRRQVALLGRASISTLHSFCLTVCQRYFHRLGLDPAFEILSAEEADLLGDEVLTAVLEQFYDRGEPAFYDLVEAYGSERGDEPLRQAILGLHALARSHPDPGSWLARAMEAFEPPAGVRMADLPFGRAALADVETSLRNLVLDLDLAWIMATGPDGPSAYGPVLAEDRVRLAGAASSVRRTLDGGSWEAAATAIVEAATFADLPRSGQAQSDPILKKAVRKRREETKDAVADLAEAFGGRTETEFLEETRRLADPMRVLVSLLTGFELAYREAKDERAVLDFGDLEHYCLEALSAPSGGPTSGPSAAAAELRERFEEVLVDEYQDTSEVQEAILRHVSRGDNLFMVGDVKQSIYRFRLAEPSLFQGKYQEFRPLEPTPGPSLSEPAPVLWPAPDGRPSGRRVVLPHNFRSRKPILDAVNYVFRQVMRPDAAEIDYSREAELAYGAGFYGPEGEVKPAVELHLLEAGVDPAAGGPAASADDPAASADAAAASADDPAAGADDPAAGADAPAERSSPDGPEVTASPSPEDLRVVEREACLVAQRVKDMVERPAPLLIWDKNAETYRPARYRDIAVLMRATTGLANQVLEAFARMGVPAYAHLSAGYFAAVEVETALSLLRLIDNPRQDIPLAAVLRSSIVGLDEADLARIRLSFRPGDFYDAVRATAAGAAVDPAVDPVLASRLRTFLERLETWRDAARRGPLSELVWRLLRETGFYAHTGGLPNGAQRQANLRGLHDRARLFDQFSRQGLVRFLRFLDRLRESEGDLGPPPPLGEGENAVSVLSIHRAKGQEFPVVFLIHLGKRFNLSDARGDLLCHRTLGLGPAVADPIRRLKYPSLAGRAVSQARRADAVAEEMRCLYVGMTRARDCLVLVGSKRNLASGLGRWCLPESAASEEAGAPGMSAPPEARPRLTAARVAGARTYLDWIVPAVAAHPEAAPLRSISGYEPGSLADPSRWVIRLWGLPGFPEVTTLAEPPLSREAGEVNWDRIADLAPLPEVANGPLRAGLDWVYPAARLSLLPAKIAPSELKRLWQRGLDEDAVTRPTPAGATRPAFLREAPAGLTSAEKGQATHLLLRHADLSGPLDEEALSALAGTLADREVMSLSEAQGADVKGVARFFSSELGGWLVASRDRVRREVPFTLGLPAAEVYGSGTDWPGVESAEARVADPSSAETVLIQGIIDVIVDEPDGLTILDFKTDAIAADEAVARAETYRPQVDLYRRAVETIWNRPVKAAVLCFLSPGRAVRVAKGSVAGVDADRQGLVRFT